MSNLFEDYREISNVSDKLALVIELVQSPPRRVFLTEQGEVKAIVLSPRDYEDLWKIELDRDMKLCDEEPETFPHEEFIRRTDEMIAAKMREKGLS